MPIHTLLHSSVAFRHIQSCAEIMHRRGGKKPLLFELTAPTPPLPQSNSAKWAALQEINVKELHSIREMQDMPLPRWAEWADDFYAKSCSDNDGLEEVSRREGKRAR